MEQQVAVGVSVVIPAYNGEAYIAASLSSVLSQTFADFEIVVVNDGSTDSTADIVSDFAARDSRVRQVAKPNSGISDTLNLGLAKARGELIARLDADDIMLPDRLMRQVDQMSRHADMAICGTDFECIDSHGRVLSVVRPSPHDRAEYDRMVARRAALAFTHPTVMFRKALAESVGGYDRRYEPVEDMMFFGQMLDKGGFAVVIPEILNQYRMHSTSISRNNIWKQCVMAEYARQRHYGLLQESETVTPQTFLARFSSVSPRDPILRLKLLKRLMTKIMEYRRMGA